MWKFACAYGLSSGRRWYVLLESCLVSAHNMYSCVCVRELRGRTNASLYSAL